MGIIKICMYLYIICESVMYSMSVLLFYRSTPRNASMPIPGGQESEENEAKVKVLQYVKQITINRHKG